MRPNKVYLSQLTTATRNYKVKVHIIEKGRPKRSPKTGTLYQTLLLQDEQGSRMRGTLFGEQIEGYNNVLLYNGQYEITNAPIKPCDERWRVRTSNLNFQMQFGKPAIVEPVEANHTPLQPQYRNIAQIPKTADPEDKYDIAAVVLYVEAQPRRITRDEGRVIAVREIVVIDHSTEQPLIISAWNDLAEDDCDLLIEKAEQLHVVGFTALKVSPHRGFSMTTTMSTTIIHSPDGEKPHNLEDWAANHSGQLTQFQARILTLKGLMGDLQTTTISALRIKKANTTLQDERYKLHVKIPDSDFQKLNAYLGCSNCSKRTNTTAGNTFNCSNCSKSGSKSIPRITFNCDVSDGTGILPITAFTTDAEKIFNMLAPEIFRMKHSEDLATFGALKNRLQTSPITIEVGPNTTLSMNNVLHWVLKRVVDHNDNPPQSPTNSTTSHGEPPSCCPQDITTANSDKNTPASASLDKNTDKHQGQDSSATAQTSIQPSKLTSVKIEGSKAFTKKTATLPLQKNTPLQKTGSPAH